jgi:hypothetical protein
MLPQYDNLGTPPTDTLVHSELTIFARQPNLQQAIKQRRETTAALDKALAMLQRQHGISKVKSQYLHSLGKALGTQSWQ